MRRNALIPKWATLPIAVGFLLSNRGVQLAGWVRGAAWREDALLRCHERNARRVASAVVRLQGLFVKVGQLLSMLSTVLPAEFRQGLEALQDRVPPRPRRSPAPRSRTCTRPSSPTARRVAVKVQHLRIERLARQDLRTIGSILRVVAFFVRLRGLPSVHGDLRVMIEDELDFAREAGNLEVVAAAFAGDPGVVFPAVVPERSTRRVLTTTFVEGIKVSRREELVAAGFDLEAVAARILGAYCRMIFEHGVFHADPHPGNLFVGADGSLAFVDFGAVGRLSPAMREGIPELFEAVIARDPGRILGAMRRMGFVSRAGDERTAE